MCISQGILCILKYGFTTHTQSNEDLSPCDCVILCTMYLFLHVHACICVDLSVYEPVNIACFFHVFVCFCVKEHFCCECVCVPVYFCLTDSLYENKTRIIDI